MGSRLRGAEAGTTSERKSETMIPHVEFVSFGERHEKLWDPKGVRECQVEDLLRGNLAPPGDPEENASHHIAMVRVLVERL